MKKLGQAKKLYTEDGAEAHMGFLCTGGGEFFRYTVDADGIPDKIVDVRDTMDSDGVPYGSEVSNVIVHDIADDPSDAAKAVSHVLGFEDDGLTRHVVHYGHAEFEVPTTQAELYAEIKRLRAEIKDMLAMPHDMLDPDREWKKGRPITAYPKTTSRWVRKS